MLILCIEIYLALVVSAVVIVWASLIAAKESDRIGINEEFETNASAELSVWKQSVEFE